MVRYTEIWYTVQCSRVDSDDWFAVSNQTYDNPQAARAALLAERSPNFDLRIVKHTHVEEPYGSVHFAKQGELFKGAK